MTAWVDDRVTGPVVGDLERVNAVDPLRHELRVDARAEQGEFAVNANIDFVGVVGELGDELPLGVVVDPGVFEHPKLEHLDAKNIPSLVFGKLLVRKPLLVATTLQVIELLRARLRRGGPDELARLHLAGRRILLAAVQKTSRHFGIPEGMLDFLVERHEVHVPTLRRRTKAGEEVHRPTVLEADGFRDLILLVFPGDLLEVVETLGNQRRRFACFVGAGLVVGIIGPIRTPLAGLLIPDHLERPRLEELLVEDLRAVL